MLKRLPTWLRAAVISGVQALVAALAVIVLALLVDVQAWLSDPTDPVNFSGQAAAAGAALIAFVQGVVVAIHRAARPPENTYPEPPHPA